MSVGAAYLPENIVFDPVKRFPYAQFTTSGPVTGSCP